MDGIAWFSFETISRMVQNHPEHTFYFIFDRPFHPDFIFAKNVIPIVKGPQSRHPLLWYWWFEQSIPGVLKSIKADVFLSPDGYVSLKSKVPTLSVIHDINFEHRPQDLPPSHRAYYKKYFPKFARHAKRIATVSEFSKNDIASQYGISTDKIDVVFNGVSSRFKPLSEKEKNDFQIKYTDGQPYFIVLGSIHPRKNIVNILDAFNQFKSQGQYPHKLLFAGRKQWWTKDMEQKLNSLACKGEVIFREDFNNQEVVSALGSADALVYVSLFEGFGIPINEAMKSGVPVITSNVSSMPEISQDAALLSDPNSVSSIVENMKKVIHEPLLSERLIQKGFIRANDFSWDRSAELVWSSLMKIT